MDEQNSPIWKWVVVVLGSVLLTGATSWFALWQKLATQDYVNSSIKEAFRIDEKYYEAKLTGYYKKVENHDALIGKIQINQARIEEKIDFILEELKRERK